MADRGATSAAAGGAGPTPPGAPRHAFVPAATKRSGDASEIVLFGRLACTGDPSARDALVTRYLPLARALARPFQRAGEPFDDILQVASIGLIKAVDRFDPGRGVAFSTYAMPTIVGEIKRYFRDRTWAIRVPRDLQERTLLVRHLMRDLPGELGRAATIPDLARHAQISQAEVLEALEASGAYRTTSLSAPHAVADEADLTLGEALGIEDRHFADIENRASLRALTRVLTRREREVVRLRFDEDLTQAEIGQRVGVSQMQVSRVLRTALAKLRHAADHGAQHASEPPPERAVA